MLTGLDPKSPFANKKLTELDELHQRKLKGAVLRAVNIRQIKPVNEQTSKYHIFERLNTGGTPLKPQEIRNCVFNGEFVELLRELNRDPNWRKIIGKKDFDKHQKDVELILRIFSLSGSWKEYEKPMKQFLNVAMADNRDAQSKKIKYFRNHFSKVCELIISELGTNPFHIRGPLNTSALDSVFCTILDNFDNLRLDVKSNFKSLLSDQRFDEGTYYGTSDKVVLEKRFVAAHEHLVR